MHPSFSQLRLIDSDCQHTLGHIHSQVAGSVVDGPGWRYVVFMQGCQMRCQYCHNRDSWEIGGGRLYSCGEIIERVREYSVFFHENKGGITISGGEPLLQSQFVAILLKACKRQGIHTCLDTNGYWNVHNRYSELEEVLKYTDLIMLDIKHLDPEQHKQLTGVSDNNTRRFLDYINQTKRRVRLRYVLVPGITTLQKDIAKLGKLALSMSNLEKIELLPYHRMGIEKWQAMGEHYPLEHVEPPSEDLLHSIKKQLEQDLSMPVLL